ncbi:MFS transporter [Nocardiopsis tropica]|uniref:MFS transporter n=1 Tax=Nocardiopsis tropica TaxID=109330 RepID=UPI0031E08F03
MTVETPQRRATWREWLGLAILTLPIFMMANDVSVLYLAMPAIGADLLPSASQSLWILHVGELLGAGFVLTLGRLGDRVGRRRLLLTGLAVYGAASAAAAFSPDAWTLIAARALLGLAAATLAPSALSLLRQMFTDPRQFSLAVALNLSAFSVGMALGPPLGGVLLEFFPWGALFLVNVPIALLALAALPLLLPEYRDPAAGRLDPASVLLSAGALVLAVFGLQEIAARGPQPPFLAAVGAGLVLGWLFLRRQRRTDDPLLDPGMFAARGFGVAVCLGLLMLFVAGGPNLFLVQFLQSVLGVSPGAVGLLLVLPAAAGLAGTVLTPAFLRWGSVGQVLAASMPVALAGLAVMAVAAGQGSLWGLVAGTSLLSLGGGPALTLGSQVALSAVPLEQTASASAVNDVAAGMGQTLSLALLGSVGLAVYRTTLAGAWPAGVPGSADGAAGDSVGAAMGIAGDLGGAAGTALAEAAGAALEAALRTSSVIAAAVLVVPMAAVSALLWRHRI